MNYKILNQIRVPGWIGAFMVQFSNSMIYISIVNTIMLILTFWNTTGKLVAANYLPWLSLPVFLLFFLLFGLTMLLVDYKIMLPSRIIFLNKQTCLHENPGMEMLIAMQSDIAKIKAKLGIE